MLLKIEDGFYLNTQHIIAVRIFKSELEGQFEVSIEYTAHAANHIGMYRKDFSNQVDAEAFLQELNLKVK